MSTVEDYREFYAQEIRFTGSIATSGLVDAYARVPREKFLGPAPWYLATAEARALSAAGMLQLSYVTVNDARDLYHNVVIAIDRDKDINNGQPSALGRWIDALALKPGERAFHLGCGVGYYTAIIAEVVGPTGSVVGIDFDDALAARAKENLAGYPNVAVHAADGAAFDPGPCDAILVNCGVTHPQTVWLDRLRNHGRLVLPFTTPLNPKLGHGVMAKIIRVNDSYSAEMVTALAIFSGGNLRDPAMESQMSKALRTANLFKMKSLRRDLHELTDACILHAPQSCLTTDELPQP